MQASDRILARRYAQAFFEGLDPADVGRARTELTAALHDLRDLQPLLRHPRLPLEEKCKILRAALSASVGERARKFLEYLIAKKRYPLLAAIAAEFDRIADEHARIARAHVRTAAPLSDADRALLAQKLGAYLKRQVVLDVTEDKSLIGGLVVRVEDRVLDATVARHLARLRETLTA